MGMNSGLKTGLTRTTLTLALPGVLYAGGETEADARERMKKVPGATVSVTAEASPVEVAKTPNPVKVMTAEHLESLAPRSLVDLITMTLPGQITQNGGPGTRAELQLGGTRSTDTVITLDGLRMQDSMSISPNMSLISLVGVDRLEIQQGPCSTLYGSDAMGGVMALYTAAPAAKGYQGQATLGLGTQGNRSARLRQAYANDTLWVRLDAEGVAADPSLPAENNYRHAGSSLASGFNLGESAVLRLGHRAFFSGTPVPVSSVSPSSRKYDPKRESATWNQQFRSNLTMDLGGGSTLEAALGHSTQTRMEPGSKGQYGIGSDLDQGKVTLSNSLRPVSYSFVLDAYRERGDGGVSGKDTWGEKRNLALAAEVALETDQSPVRLVLSARNEESTQASRIANAPATHTSDNRSFTWKAGATLRLSEQARVYGSIGTGFSTPLLYQVLYNAVNGGDVLQNEQSRFMQAGFSYEKNAWRFRLDGQSLNFDSMVFFDLDPSKYKYFNGQNVRFRSLEAELGYVAQAWNLTGFMRSQEARRLGVPADQQLADSAVTRRPFFTGGLRAGCVFKGVHANAAWSWSGSRYENFGKGYGIRPSGTHYNDLSLNFSYELTRYAELRLNVRNLFQDKVRLEDWLAGRSDFKNDAYTIYNYPAAPRTLQLEVKVRW